jgi:hypothetical protein
MPGGEVVGAVEHHVGARHERHQRIGGCPLADGNEVDLGIQRRQGDDSRCRLVDADPLRGMQDLSLQIGEVDRVAVDQCQAADAGGGQIQSRW